MSKRPDGSGAITKSGHISLSQGRGKFKYQHVVIAEKVLGKKLPKGAQVHHVDCVPSNNENKNLVICQDQTYHRLLHRRTRALEECGNPNFLRCSYCRCYDDPSVLKSNGMRSYYHTECRSNFRRSVYKERKSLGKSI